MLFFLLLFCHIERKNTKDFPLLISKKEGVKEKDERESVKDEKREGEREKVCVSKMRREKMCMREKEREREREREREMSEYEDL